MNDALFSSICKYVGEQRNKQMSTNARLFAELAYRAGADNELEACIQALNQVEQPTIAEALRAVRRPKQISKA